MGRVSRAARNALLVTVAWGIAMLIPGVNILGLIAVMLPLWMVHDMGVRGLGEPREGFFVPSDVGWVVGALILWALFFVFFLLVLRRAGEQA